MKFQSRLKETEQSMVQSESLVPAIPRERFIRMIESLEIGKYKLSIQASYGHYSTPRKTVEYNQYETMELAVCTDSDSFLDVSVEFPEVEELKELQDGFDGQVYAYIRVEVLQSLIDHISEVLNERV